MKIWKVEEAINNELNYVTSLNRVKSIPFSLKEEVKPQNGQQKAGKFFSRIPSYPFAGIICNPFLVITSE